MKQAFRPTAIPLITSDPYFSVWSFSDQLYEDHTRHWTGKPNSLYGVLYIDGVAHRFMGLTQLSDRHFQENKTVMEQTSVTVRPTTTVYTFTHPACDLTVTFVSPLLTDRLEVLSRPASYMFYEITPKEEGHEFEVYVDLSSQLAGDLRDQWFVASEEEGHVSLGAKEQNVLNRCGDDVRIDWGYLHLVHPNAKVGHLNTRRAIVHPHVRENTLIVDVSKPFHASWSPVLYAKSKQLSDKFVFAYDDIKSIVYYGKQIDAYYKNAYGDFDTMLKAAVAEADEMRAICAKFDAEMIAEMEEISPAYARIGSLAYRQVIAAHKLIEVDGELMFLSKENFSNGCLATLDVTYPSIPLFLRFNPELVRAMMRPLFAYARTALWPYRYAPHDCGCYPFCNGQVYSADNGVVYEKNQMPVEECGNAILTVAAALRADGDRSLAEQNRDLLKAWADYLVEYGYDPDNQLCTDDFAGHLAHNCNLSLKAIVALGAYAQMFDEPKYAEIAKDMAKRWTKDAKKQEGKGWRLAFDQENTWSLKYNIIWDRLLGLGLFDPAVSQEEIEVYKQQMKRYGVPLDSRSDYTKLDWMAWTTVMTDDADYRKEIYEAIERMICESFDRVPITDWYYASDACQAGFQARSVLGGFYINLVAKSFL